MILAAAAASAFRPYPPAAIVVGGFFVALTLAQFRDTIYDVGLGSTTALSSAQITRYINLAQIRVARAHDFQELRELSSVTLGYTGVAATDKVIDLPTLLGTSLFRDVYDFVIVDGSNSLRLEALTPQGYDAQIPYPEQFATGRPTVYSVWTAESVLLWRVPDEAYDAKIRWLRWPTPLANDADVVDFDNKDELLIHLTLSFVQSLRLENERSLYHWQIYQRLLTEAIAEDRRKPDLLIVRPTFLPLPRVSPVPPNYWADPFYKG